MNLNSKKLVLDTLEFRNESGRVPRQIWVLPWATQHFPKEYSEIIGKFEWDFYKVMPQYVNRSICENGNAYAKGEYTDQWGCVFSNIHEGIIGEVKNPISTDEDWNDVDNIHIPSELLELDFEAIRHDIANQRHRFLISPCVACPFEQLQFIRGTEQLFMDIMFIPEKMRKFIDRMHQFYCGMIEQWCKTDIDAIFFMDDWGTQNQLLISPQMWESMFKPLYKDYIDIAHRNGKKAFMHSDGNTLAIIPHLIELGLDALNCQIFCMGVDCLAQFKGKITFWGEMDRQHIIPFGTQQDVDDAVKKVYGTLWDNGGCIAQCEFGPGAKPENIMQIYKSWETVRGQPTIRHC